MFYIRVSQIAYARAGLSVKNKSRWFRLYRRAWVSQRTTYIYYTPIFFVHIGRALIWLWRYRLGYYGLAGIAYRHRWLDVPAGSKVTPLWILHIRRKKGEG